MALREEGNNMGHILMKVENVSKLYQMGEVTVTAAKKYKLRYL